MYDDNHEVTVGSRHTRARRMADERGQGLVEYALIIALVSLAAIVALGFLSGKINGLFSKTGNSLDASTAAVGSGGTPPGNGTIVTIAGETYRYYNPGPSHGGTPRPARLTAVVPTWPVEAIPASTRTRPRIPGRSAATRARGAAATHPPRRGRSAARGTRAAGGILPALRTSTAAGSRSCGVAARRAAGAAPASCDTTSRRARENAWTSGISNCSFDQLWREGRVTTLRGPAHRGAWARDFDSMGEEYTWQVH